MLNMVWKINKKIFVISLALTVSLGANIFFLLNSCKKKEEQTTNREIMFRIGQTTIYIDEFKAFLDSLPEIRKIELIRYPEKNTQVVSEFIEAVSILEYARQRGYLDRPEIKIRILSNTAELVRPQIFINEVRPYMQVDFKEIQEFYEKNKEMFKHPEVARVMKISGDKKELEELRKQFKSVKDFVEYAQYKYSPAEFDYGYISRDANLPKEIIDMIFSMNAGEISKPVKFGDNYAIFAVIDKLGEGYWPLEQSVERIFKAVRDKKMRDRISQITKEFLVSTDVYVNFEGIQKELKVTLSREKFEQMFMEKFVGGQQ